MGRFEDFVKALIFQKIPFFGSRPGHVLVSLGLALTPSPHGGPQCDDPQHPSIPISAHGQLKVDSPQFPLTITPF